MEPMKKLNKNGRVYLDAKAENIFHNMEWNEFYLGDFGLCTKVNPPKMLSSDEGTRPIAAGTPATVTFIYEHAISLMCTNQL